MVRKHYAGIDLGATHIRAAVATGDGTIVSKDRRSTPQGPRGVDITDAVLNSLRAACSDAGIDPAEIVEAGIGSFGPFDLAAGTVVTPANLPDSIDVIPLRQPVAELVGNAPVTLYNDTTAGVIGERYYSELNPDDMIYLTISSGIGAGIAVDGAVLHGWDGNAGEVGHMLVDPARRRTCGCGKSGHWEAYCSGGNVPAYARELHDEDGIETGLDTESAEFTAETVFDAPEDPLAAEVIDRVADWNAIGVANLVHAYAPLVVAIGGAVALHNPELVLEPIKQRVPDMIMSNVPEIRATSLGDEVVLYGAIASAISGDGEAVTH